MKHPAVKIISQHGTKIGDVAVTFTVGRIRRIKCEECGQNYVDKRGEICEGCDAYREHTGHF